MKFILSIFFILLILPIFAFYHEYFVEIEDRGSVFVMNVRTFKENDTKHLLRIDDFKIEKATFLKDGIIDLKVIVDPHDYSFKEKGPHTGSFSFRKTINLSNGRYHFTINDQDYGFITIYQRDIYFDPINCL